MSIKSSIQVVAMIATMAFLGGRLPAIQKQVQVAKIHLLNASRASAWGRAMFP